MIDSSATKSSTNLAVGVTVPVAVSPTARTVTKFPSHVVEQHRPHCVSPDAAPMPSRQKFDTFAEVVWSRLGKSPFAATVAVSDAVRLALSPLGHPQRRALASLAQMRRQWSGYDYGHGYFYQASEMLGISGRRSTECRIESMSLKDRLSGKRVLDIGSNTGFIALHLAQHASEIIGIDPNPFYIDIADNYRTHLNINNVSFIANKFENFAPSQKFDAILSLSNHFTYDGYLLGSIASYLARCRELLVEGGLFICESHPPQFEARAKGQDGLQDEIASVFDISLVGDIASRKSLDKSRVFFVGVAK